MPGYTIKTLDDVPDVLGDYPGEMRMLTGALESEQVALTYRRMPQHTGGKGSYGHRHADAGGDLLRDLAASCSSSSSDDVVECGGGTAIRVAPEVSLGLERRARGRRARDRLDAGRRHEGASTSRGLLARVART